MENNETERLEGEIVSPEEELAHALEVIRRHMAVKPQAAAAREADSFRFSESNHPNDSFDVVERSSPSQLPAIAGASGAGLSRETIDGFIKILEKPENIEAIVQGGASGILFRFLNEYMPGWIAGALGGAASGYAADKIVNSKRRRRRRPTSQPPQYPQYNPNQIGHREDDDVL